MPREFVTKIPALLFSYRSLSGREERLECLDSEMSDELGLKADDDGFNMERLTRALTEESWLSFREQLLKARESAFFTWSGEILLKDGHIVTVQATGACEPGEDGGYDINGFLFENKRLK